MVNFDSRQPGTPESVWAGSAALRAAEPLRLGGLDRLAVLAAHPDDETLGAGGLISHAARAGARIRVVVATLGENSHPDSPTHTPEDLARRRRAEAVHALAALADDIVPEILGLPDGGLDTVRDRVREAVEEAVAWACAGRRGAVAAPWGGDGHVDHEVLGQEARRAAAARGLECLEYPVWLWHWGTPADLPAAGLRVLALDGAARRAKAAALAAHGSQVRPLSDRPGDEVLLGPHVLVRFGRPQEHFVVTAPMRRSPAAEEHDAAAPDADAVSEPEPESEAEAELKVDAPFAAAAASGAAAVPAAAAVPDTAVAPDAAAVFDAVHRRAEDPWDVDSSWYERRKRAVTLAALPRERYRAALEIGCSVGALTEDLADRADTVLGTDASAVAAEQARRRTFDRANVRIERRRMPQEWPDGKFDLVVASEVGYFLSTAELAGVLERTAACLRADGHLLLCHWRHPVEGWPLDGPDVHRAVRADPRFRRVVQHVEQDFELEAFAPADGHGSMTGNGHTAGEGPAGVDGAVVGDGPASGDGSVAGDGSTDGGGQASGDGTAGGTAGGAGGPGRPGGPGVR